MTPRVKSHQLTFSVKIQYKRLAVDVQYYKNNTVGSHNGREKQRSYNTNLSKLSRFSSAHAGYYNDIVSIKRSGDEELANTAQIFYV
jgi:hypothetical protein